MFSISSILPTGTLAALAINEQAQNTIQRQISTGNRINSPADDPGGYAQLSQLQFQLSKFTGQQNSLLSTKAVIGLASSGIGGLVSGTNELRSLEQQIANPNTSESDRKTLAQKLKDELTQLAKSTADNLYLQNVHNQYQSLLDAISPSPSNGKGNADGDDNGKGDDEHGHDNDHAGGNGGQPAIDITTAAGATQFAAQLDSIDQTLKNAPDQLKAQSVQIDSQIAGLKTESAALSGAIKKFNGVDLNAAQAKEKALQVQGQLQAQSIGIFVAGRAQVLESLFSFANQHQASPFTVNFNPTATNLNQNNNVISFAGLNS